MDDQQIRPYKITIKIIDLQSECPNFCLISAYPLFEARRLTIEALVKIYLEQVSSSRNLVTVYLRLMFTLSLGALAGVITLYGTMLRFGTSASISMITPLEVVLAIAALAALVTSALLSARALQKSAFDVAPLLHNPFPSADSVIDS
ncbi:TPA: hypothetical protein SLV52_003098, partial [Pseudomonas aeruginosa]|nr:hypothetical protein [Pseudomonas aeruginosa]